MIWLLWRLERWWWSYIPRHWSQFEAAFSTALPVKPSRSCWQKYDILTESRDTSSCVLLQPNPFLHSGSSPKLPVLFFLSFPYHTGEARVPRGAPQRRPLSFWCPTKMELFRRSSEASFSSCCTYFCVPQVNQARKHTDNLLEIESLLFVIMFFFFFLRRPIYSSGTSRPTHTHTQVWNPSTADHRTRSPTREGVDLLGTYFFFLFKHSAVCRNARCQHDSGGRVGYGRTQ